MRRVPSAFSGSADAVADRNPAGPVIYFNTLEGKLCSYSHRTKTLRTIAEHGRLSFDITELNGMLYFGDYNTLYSCDPITRETKKAAKVYGSIECLTGLDGILYMGVTYTCDCDFYPGPLHRPPPHYYELHCYNPKSGNTDKVMRVTGARDSIHTVIKSDKILYFSSGGNFYSYNPRTKELETLTEDDKWRITCIAENDGILYFSRHKEIRSYNPLTKKQEKAAKTKKFVYNMAGADSVLYFGCRSKRSRAHYLCSYDLKNKRRKKLAKFNDRINNMVVADGVLYFSIDDKFCSYDPKSGKEEQITEADWKIECVIAAAGRR